MSLGVADMKITYIVLAVIAFVSGLGCLHAWNANDPLMGATIGFMTLATMHFICWDLELEQQNQTR